MGGEKVLLINPHATIGLSTLITVKKGLLILRHKPVSWRGNDEGKGNVGSR